MTTTGYLCRHFSCMGARLKVQTPGPQQGEKVRIDVGRDRDGEFFDVRCQNAVVPEILDVQPAARHLVLMIRDGRAKHKFLLGHERHWFAAAAPGDDVRDVRTAIENLLASEVAGRHAIRQGEWFFVPVSVWQRDRINEKYILHNEPLRRGTDRFPPCTPRRRPGAWSCSSDRAGRSGAG